MNHYKTMSKKLHGKTKEAPPPQSQDELWATFDLGCAAAIIGAGYKLDSLDKENPRKVQFLFEKSDGLLKVVDNYWSDRLIVKARTFFDTIKMLKNRIYSE